MQRFEDIDDSLSNISTVSDDSEPDSGYDHSNWVSKLAALSEIEESDYEVVPRLNWPEVHNSSEEQALYRGASVSSLLSNDNGDVESVSNPNEMISRAEWDRILRSEPRPLDASLVRNLSSGTTTTTTTPSGDTLKERQQQGHHQDIAGAAGSSSQQHHHRSSTPTKKSAILHSSRGLRTTPKSSMADSNKERTGSWLSNIFRKNTNLSQYDANTTDQQQPGTSAGAAINRRHPPSLVESCDADNHVGEFDNILPTTTHGTVSLEQPQVSNISYVYFKSIDN